MGTNLPVLALAGLGLIALLPAPAHGGSSDPAVVGEWGGLLEWPFRATHAVLLPTGKVLLWQESGEFLFFNPETKIYLWDPGTGELEPAPLDSEADIFCSAHVLLGDGRVMVVGGNVPPWSGNPFTYFFNPWTETWYPGPPMAVDRYYPTLVSLADGRVLAAGGTDGVFQPSHAVEALTPGPGESWVLLEGAERDLGEYPHLHALPDGRVADVGPRETTLFFDPSGFEWTDGPPLAHAPREGGSSVVLPGLDRVLIAGGAPWGQLPHATAEILELSPEPAWHEAAPLHHARRDFSLTLLADGSPFAVGGSLGPLGALWSWPPVLEPEVFDAAAGTWSPMAPHARLRSYHSVSVLLPDGRVLVAGGELEGFLGEDGPEHSAEIFSPTYLFRGARPVVEAAPSEVSYGTTFDVAVDDAASIARVALARAGSVTHGLNFDQRYVDLDYAATDEGTLRVGAPAGTHVAPAGWYLLFVVSAEGVPAIAPLVALGA